MSERGVSQFFGYKAKTTKRDRDFVLADGRIMVRSDPVPRLIHFIIDDLNACEFELRDVQAKTFGAIVGNPALLKLANETAAKIESMTATEMKEANDQIVAELARLEREHG